MNVILIEIPHQLPPKVGAWDKDDLLAFMRNTSRATWRKVTREDLMEETWELQDLKDVYPDAAALFEAGETEIIECSTETTTEFVRIQDRKEFWWYAEHTFQDNNWYWIGSPEDARDLIKDNELPAHRQTETRTALENCLENL
jgi:hypothetical protein